MALFTRKDQDSVPEVELTAELLQLIAVAADAQDTALEAARGVVGSAESWSADLAGGTISFVSKGATLTGPVQLIGSLSPDSATWLWSWANTGMPEHVIAAASAAAAYGDANGLTALTTPKLGGVDASLADELAAVAIHVSGSGTMYRAQSGAAVAYLAFGELS